MSTSEHFTSATTFRFSPDQNAKMTQQKNQLCKRDTSTGFPSLGTASAHDFQSMMIARQQRSKQSTAVRKTEKRGKRRKKKKKRTKELVSTKATESVPLGARTPADGQYTFMEGSEFRFSPDQAMKVEDQENNPCKR